MFSDEKAIHTLSFDSDEAALEWLPILDEYIRSDNGPDFIAKAVVE